MMFGRTYSLRETFYDADHRRRHSGEADYGYCPDTSLLRRATDDDQLERYSQRLSEVC